MKKVGIMGGTFDPIHYGHLIIAENAAEQFSLDHIFFMPTGHSPHKDDHHITPPKLRCDMISLAISDNDKFSLSMLEVESDQVNYTYKTLETLKKKYVDMQFYFILGADSLFMIEKWVHPERIFKACTILAAVREELDKERLENRINQLKERYRASIFPLATPNFDVSSHHIRKRTASSYTIRYMVPREVELYIKEKKLYLTKNN